MAERPPRRARRPAERPQVAAPSAAEETEPTAAGPSTAVGAGRVPEEPLARPVQDATAPLSGTRGGPSGSKAGPGGVIITAAESGALATTSPAMPGPSGAAAPTSERVGDPGAGGAVHGAEAGAVAGATAGTAAGGPVGAIVAAPVGAMVGALGGGAESPLPPPPGPATVPGGGGTGPTDPIYDVARIQREVAARGRG